MLRSAIALLIKEKRSHFSLGKSDRVFDYFFGRAIATLKLIK